MGLPDTKVASGIMKDLEAAIENANNKQRAHDSAAGALNAAQNDLNAALAKVDELKSKLFDHLGTPANARQA